MGLSSAVTNESKNVGNKGDAKRKLMSQINGKD